MKVRRTGGLRFGTGFLAPTSITPHRGAGNRPVNPGLGNRRQGRAPTAGALAPQRGRAGRTGPGAAGDGDGWVAADEYRTCLDVSGLYASLAETFFRRADLDRDGNFTGRELVEAMRDFLLGSDAEAAGNYLYGALS